MPIKKDPRYDVLFCDPDSSGSSNKTLGLVLRESGGGVDFGVQAVSPYANRITQGDLQDSDFSRGTVRTQRDWTGGFGKLFTYQETDAFLEGTADTRFRNQVVLGPKLRKSRFYTSSNPEYLGEGTSNTTAKVQSQWNKRASVSHEAYARWEDTNKAEKSWVVSDDISPIGNNYETCTGALSPQNVSAEEDWNPVSRLSEIEKNFPERSMKVGAFSQAFTGVSKISFEKATMFGKKQDKNVVISMWVAVFEGSSSNGPFLFKSHATFIFTNLSYGTEQAFFNDGVPQGNKKTFDLDPQKNYQYVVNFKVLSGTFTTLVESADDFSLSDFRFQIFTKRTVSSVSKPRSGKFLKWKYVNSTNSSVSISRVYLDCAGSNLASGTVRVGGGNVLSAIGPTGQGCAWNTTVTNASTRRSWVEIVLPSPVSVAAGQAHYMFASVVSNEYDVENLCQLFVYNNSSSSDFFVVSNYTQAGAQFDAGVETSGAAVNFLVNTLNEYGDPDTRTGSFVTWKLAASKAISISSVSIYVEATRVLDGGCPVYLCVSTNAITYFDGSVVSSGPSLQKVQFYPSSAGWYLCQLPQSVSFSSGQMMYFGVVATANSALGQTSLRVYGSERDGFTDSVSFSTIAGLNVSPVNQSGCVYFKINEGIASDFPQWSKKMYRAAEVTCPFTFTGAFANRNHTLRLKMRVSASGFIPSWTLNASLKVSIMDGATEFASQTFTAAEAFPNNESQPFSISEKWVAIDFGTKSSTAKTYTIKVTPIAVQGEEQKISVYVYGSSTASGGMASALYDPISLGFGGSTALSPAGKMYYSFFSSDDMPTRDTSISSGARAGAYWHEYFGTDRRVAWTIKSKNATNWVLSSIRFHAKMIRWDGSATVALRLYANNNGAPASSSVRDVLIDKSVFSGVYSKSGWVTVPVPAYTVAAANTTLWASLECDTPGWEDKVEFDLTCGKTTNYSTVMASATDGLPFGGWSTSGATTAVVSSYSASTKTITTAEAHGFAPGMRVTVGASSAAYTIASKSASGITLTTSVSPSPAAGAAVTEVIDYDPIWVLNEGTGSSDAVERPPFSYGGNWFCFGGTQLYALNASSQNVASSAVISYNASTKQVTLASTHAFTSGMYVAIANNVRKVTTATSSTITLDEGISPSPAAGDVAAGAAVWEPATAFNQKIQCAAQLGDYLYIGFGNAATCQRGTFSNGAWSFSNIQDGANAVYGSYMRQHLGYLYISKASGGADSLRATNGDLSRWDRITVGTADIEVTALASLGSNLIVLSKTKMFEISSVYASHMYNYEIEANTNNGRGAIQWVADGRLYVPIKNGLNAFDGVRMTPVGPEQGYGLPNGMQGSISCMSGTKDFLYAAVDAGASGYSSVLAWNGKGWHVVYKSPTRGQRIQAIGMEALVDARPRLWIFEGQYAHYITFPSLTDNPYQYVGAEYDGDDYVVSSWFGGELSAVLKDMQSVFVKADGCTQRCKIMLDLEADNSGVWCRIGEVTESPHVEFDLDIPGMTAKSIRAFNTTGGVKTLWVNETLGDVSVGEFVSINGEVRQVTAIGSGSFTISVPLTETPSVGDMVLPSRPVGKEFRYRATLISDDASQTPKLVRVSFRMQEYSLSRFRFSLSAVIDDDILWRTGGIDRDTEAAAYRSEVYSWMKRTTPFTMVAPDGKNWRVKIMSGSESQWTRKEIGQSNQRFASVIQLQLDEV